MVKSLSILVLAIGWAAYLGTTAYVGWLMLSGSPPAFLESYTIGLNAAWVAIGFVLWLATEWIRGFRNI
jgi:apolipoprotein N-acyltransferase